MPWVVILISFTCALWVVPPRRTQSTRQVRSRSVSTVRKRIHQRWGRGKHSLDQPALIGAALTSVAARLRAGQSPANAWVAVSVRLPDPIAADILRLASGEEITGKSPGATALHAANAAMSLAAELGAELAPVLEACAAGIEEAARAQAERDAAFAGPKATAHLLMALPLAGLGLGGVMGAKPWELFTSTVWGALLAVMAAVLMGVGRWWTTTLLTRAANSDEEE